MDQHRLIVIIDGVCILCDGFGRFITRFNPEARLMWAQHEDTIKFLEKYNISPDDSLKSIVAVKEGRVFRGSDAFIEALLTMQWYWRALAYFMKLFPHSVREFVYSHISSNRHSLFGKKEACSVKYVQEMRPKFLHPI